jgi:hypothetical protein
MEDALRNFLAAGRKLSEVWDNDKVKKYPKYLPSFDEFLSDFAGMSLLKLPVVFSNLYVVGSTCR